MISDERILELAASSGVAWNASTGEMYLEGFSDRDLKDDLIRFARALLKEAGSEELEKDAMRYRWLQNSTNDVGPMLAVVAYWSEEYRGQARHSFVTNEVFNALVDAEIEKQK